MSLTTTSSIVPLCHTPYYVTLNHPPTANAGALAELLEVPQLMEACVRNGSYDEALDLKAFVNKLGFMHGCVCVCVCGVVNKLGFMHEYVCVCVDWGTPKHMLTRVLL